MKLIIKHLWMCVLLLNLNGVYAQTKPLTEAQKIEYLINSIGKLKGATFIRNGSDHDATEAASHLRRKVNYVGDNLKTVEQFISEIASKSSWSGKAYQIKLSDGKLVTSEEFLKNQLKKLLAGHTM